LSDANFVVQNYSMVLLTKQCIFINCNLWVYTALTFEMVHYSPPPVFWVCNFQCPEAV